MPIREKASSFRRRSLLSLLLHLKSAPSPSEITVSDAHSLLRLRYFADGFVVEFDFFLRWGYCIPREREKVGVPSWTQRLRTFEGSRVSGQYSHPRFEHSTQPSSRTVARGSCSRCPCSASLALSCKVTSH